MAEDRSERWHSLVARSNALERDTNAARVEALARELIECDPNDPLGYRVASRAKRLRRDWAGAVEMSREALARSPESAYLHFVLALSLRLAGSLEEARAHIEASIATEPGWAPYWNERGWIQLLDGDARAATACAAKALSLSPENADARYLHASSLPRSTTAQQRAALKAFDAVLAVDPEYSLAWGERGRVLIRLGDGVAAETALRTSLSIEPSDPDFRKSLFDLLRRRSLVYRALRFPGRFLANLAAQRKKVPVWAWVAILLVGRGFAVGFLLALAVFVMLVFLFVFPVRWLHEHLTLADVRRAVSPVPHGHPGPLRMHRWPRSVRWPLLGVLVGSWWALLTIAAWSGDVDRDVLRLLAGAVGATLALVLAGVILVRRRRRARRGALDDSSERTGT